MTGDVRRGRPGKAAPEIAQGDGDTVSVAPGPDSGMQVRRRAASYRCEPFPCGHRDPLDHRSGAGPGTFGLSRAELLAEVRRLQREGWRQWEITRRFVDPKFMPLPEGVGAR